MVSKQEDKNKCLLLEQELEKLRKDQEDLLVLLADQDSKINHYKDRLKQLGEKVTES